MGMTGFKPCMHCRAGRAPKLRAFANCCVAFGFGLGDDDDDGDIEDDDDDGEIDHGSDTDANGFDETSSTYKTLLVCAFGAHGVYLPAPAAAPVTVAAPEVCKDHDNYRV